MNIGDPVFGPDLTSYYRAEDASLSTANGELSFRRMYVSSDETWAQVSPGMGRLTENLPKPFGSTATSGHTSLRWWHNYFSFVAEMPGGQRVVRDTNGSQTMFSNPGSCTECELLPDASNPSVQHRLFRTLNNGQGYILRRDDGITDFYQDVYDTGTVGDPRWYMLTRSEGPARKLRYSVYYRAPQGLFGGPQGCPYSPHLVDGAFGKYYSQGTPYIFRVLAPGGEGLEFQYAARTTYTGATECPISSIDAVATNDTRLTLPLEAPSARPPASAPRRPLSALAVSFTYWFDGLVGAATGPQLREEYDYTDDTFTRLRGGDVVARQRLDATGHVYEASGEGASYSFFATPPRTLDSPQRVNCEAQSLCCANPSGNPIRREMNATAGAGDGSGGTAVLGKTADYAVDYQFGHHGARLYQAADKCLGAPNCSPGTIRYENRGAPLESAPPGPALQCGGGVPGYLHAVKDKRDNFTVTPNVAVPLGSGRTRLEQRQTLRGAADMDGNGALQVESYTWLYDGFGLQRPEKTLRTSLLGGTPAVSAKQYEFGTRLEADYAAGYTLARDGTVEARRVKTFYRTSRVCEASAPDAHQRTLRVEGPCFVASESASSCQDSSYPVTEFTYYADGAPGTKGGRLQKVVRYPNHVAGTCGLGLAEDYLGYTIEGDALQTRDANGVTTDFTWEGRRLASKTVGGRTWRYVYREGVLAEVVFPEGNREVYCYRKNTPAAACAAGTFTTLLQWKAKTAGSDGSTWSEKVVYTYREEDQALLSETKRDACFTGCTPTSGEVRSVRRYDADAYRRPTFEAAGVAGAPSTSTVRGFDGADNLVGIGHAFNAPPAFCKEPGGVPSAVCARLAYDSANRLIEVKQNSNVDQAVLTRLAYDAHGNVCAVTQGASAGWALSSECKVAAPDDARTAYYQHDDFGNVVAARLPDFDFSIQGPSGAIRFQHDAQGNVVFKQTPQMFDNGTWLAFRFDRLGRLLSTRKEWPTGGEVLFSTVYDFLAASPQGCPPLANTMGRPVRTDDPMGGTLFSYDAEGRVLLEARLRNLGATVCDTPHREASLHTEYTYTLNGNLATLTYPHGRKVSYSHYADFGRNDRVESVSVDYFQGGVAAPKQLLQGVTWEPYGGLRGYIALNPETGGAALSVAYHLGDDSSAPKAGPCAAATTAPSQGASDDETGRLRALIVSRGTGEGNVFRRWYTWKGELQTKTQTCVLGQGPFDEDFGYDQMLRVDSAHSGYVGSFDALRFQWDTRGNMVRQVLNAAGDAYEYTAHPSPMKPDQVTKVAASAAGTDLSLSYSHDLDGRVQSMSWPPDSTGTDNDRLLLSYGPDAAHAGVDSAINAAGVHGLAFFNYYFDAQGRRRRKMYPSGVVDEFLYDTGHQMLEDRGVAEPFAPSQFFQDVPLDEYVWLGGRPVVLVRGRFDYQVHRQDDGVGDCIRNDEASRCGVYFPITDDIGKAVLLLDSQGRISGTGEYDVFGHVNRRQVWGESQHPYPAGVAVQVPAVHQQTLGLEMDMRVQFHTIDTESCRPPGPFSFPQLFDPLYLVNPSSLAQVGPYGGHHKGSLWTDWLKASPGGDVNVSFVPDGESRSPDSDGCASGSDTGFPYQGYSVRQAEFRRYETGVTPTWLPLRFPGQYHDAETDLFENWHRNYDAFRGSYLQPEPMLTTAPSNFGEVRVRSDKRASRAGRPVLSGLSPVPPELVEYANRLDRQAPTNGQDLEETTASGPYGYGKNDPINRSDPSGLISGRLLSACSVSTEPVPDCESGFARVLSCMSIYCIDVTRLGACVIGLPWTVEPRRYRIRCLPPQDAACGVPS